MNLSLYVSFCLCVHVRLLFVSTGGLTPAIRSLTIATIRDFHRKFYRPDNLTVIVTGTDADRDGGGWGSSGSGRGRGDSRKKEEIRAGQDAEQEGCFPSIRQ